jgi:hypothetical protein
VDPAMIGAVATLLTAAVGLAVQLMSSKPTGKPWMIGLAALAVMGVVLLVAALLHIFLPNGPPPSPTRDPYQNQVVSICTEDRESELKFKRQLEQMQQNVTTGDVAAIFSIPKLMTDTIVEVQGLADRLETLHPPADLEPVQSEAVSSWRRGIAVSRENRDKVEKLAVDSGGDPFKFAEAITHLDYTEETRLESQKDVLLRRLGGSGCNPSP